MADVNETMIQGTKVVSGETVTFDTPREVDIKSLKVYFSPKQDLHGFSRPFPVGGGKNLLNLNVEFANPSNTVYTPTNNRIFAPGTYCVGASYSNYFIPSSIISYSILENSLTIENDNVYGIGFPLKLTAGQRYITSAITSSGGIDYAYYDSTGAHIGYDKNKKGVAVTIPENTDITVVIFYKTNSTGNPETFTNIQLEKGTVATDYEPYAESNICPIEGWESVEVEHSGNNSNSYTLDWSSEFGTIYGGYVDLVKGELVEEWKTMHPKDYNWYNYSGNKIFYCPGFKERTADSLDISDKLKTSYGYGWDATSDNSIVSGNNATMFIKHMGVTSETEFKTWLIETDPIVCYKLATPITYSLTPQQITAFKNTNTFWSNADRVEVEYDFINTFNAIESRKNIMNNTPRLATTKADIANFSTDMVAPIKDAKFYFKPKQDLNGYTRPWAAGCGKNLFNLNVEYADPDDTTINNTTNRIFTTNTYCVGTSYSNWFDKKRVQEYTIQNNTLTVLSSSGYGVGFSFKLQAGSTYSISAVSQLNNGIINLAHYQADGTYIANNASNYRNTSFTVPDNADITVIIFRSQSSSEGDTFSNIQLELGSSATTYEPYENVCPIEGWNEIGIYQTGKNMIPLDAVEYAGKQIPRPMTGLIDDSIYPSFYFPAPKGNIVLKKDTNSNYNHNPDYICLTDVPPVKGVQFWGIDGLQNGITSFGNYQTRTIDNSDGHKYIVIMGSKGIDEVSTADFIEKVQSVKLRMSMNNGQDYSDPVFRTVSIEFPPIGKNLFNPNAEWFISKNRTYLKFIDDPEQLCTISFIEKDSSIDLSGISLGFAYDSDDIERGYNWVLNNGTLTSNLNNVTRSSGGSQHDVVPKGTICQYLTHYPSTTETLDMILQKYDIQIEIGSTATSYEPFTNTVYGGYVDIIRGVLVNKWKKTKISNWQWEKVATSSDGISIFSTAWKTAEPSDLELVQAQELSNIICESYTTGAAVSASFVNTMAEASICQRYPYATWYIKDSRYDNVKDFVSAMGDEIILYKTIAPTEYKIDKAILRTFRDTNNIWSNTNDQTEITYWKHKDETQQYIPAENVLASNDNFIVVTDDGYVIGDENDYIEY